MQKVYLSKEDGASLSFPYDWHQTFDHPFDMTKSLNESMIIKDFIATPPDERKATLEILIYLYNFTFATKDQLTRLLKLRHIEIPSLDELLNKCVFNRLANRFTLSAYVMESLPADAFQIYCLDHSSRHVLSHLYRDDIAVTWRSTNSIRNAEQVSKYLATNEFYLSLLPTKENCLRSFQPAADFSIGKRDIRLSAAFCLMNGAAQCNFLLEVVRYSDIPVYWQKKSGEQIDVFLDKYWNKYFDIEPVCIFLAENIEQGLELAKIFWQRTERQNFRITTDTEIMKGINNAKFYKYVPEKGKFAAVSPTIFRTSTEKDIDSVSDQ